ncbi:MAG: hypothetical protein P4M08_10320 [Oligoflexia bacterium]|nr:hypothetical protein [Oligoflexia bacterium]
MDKPLLLDLNLELLNDCKWQCGGCHVATKGQDGFSGGDLARLNALADEFKSRGYRLNFLNITPTDFMVARNTLDILRDPGLRALIHKFDFWYLTSTFLAEPDEHQEEIIDVINRDYADTSLYFYVVMNPMKVLDEKYMQRIVEKKNRFISRLKTRSLRQFVIFNWYEYPDPRVMNAHRDYVNTSKWYRDHFSANQDYVMSFARKPEMRKYKDDFIKSIDWLNEVIATYVPQDNDLEQTSRLEALGEDSYTAYDFLNRRYTYRNGEFYYVPFLVACLVNFDEGLKVPLREWSVDEFERCEQELIVSQFNRLPEKPRCRDCGHVGKCVERQILHTLDVIGYDGCIAPLQQYQDQYKKW